MHQCAVACVNAIEMIFNDRVEPLIFTVFGIDSSVLPSITTTPYFVKNELKKLRQKSWATIIQNGCRLNK
jgi:hypothetical protein